MSEDMVTCSLCGAVVQESETCSTQACRACHKTLTLEDCLAESDAIYKARSLRDVEAIIKKTRGEGPSD